MTEAGRASINVAVKIEINEISEGFVRENPVVSVVMPVHNSENFVTESVRSILNQTFPDFELICIDDGSSDDSLNILRKFEQADGRVRIISRANTGVTRARNDGMAVARGQYIAAMDSDDVAHPDRLRQQVAYLERDPGCVCVGAGVLVVGPDLMPINEEWKSLDHETIDRDTLAGSGSAIRQPVAMFRADAIRRVGGYRAEIFTHEETDLYLRLAEVGRLANLQGILLLYRLRLGSVNRTQRTLQAEYGIKVIADARARRGLSPRNLPEPEKGRIDIDDGTGSWALWSHYAFNGGYIETAQKYSWRALRTEPLAITSWKALIRSHFFRRPSGAGKTRIWVHRTTEA